MYASSVQLCVKMIENLSARYLAFMCDGLLSTICFRKSAVTLNLNRTCSNRLSGERKLIFTLLHDCLY